MSQTYSMRSDIAANALPTERATFMRRTYLHVAGAVFAFVMLETLFFSFIGADSANHQWLLGFLRSPVSQLLVLGGFIGAGYLARYWANSTASPTLQYMGLGLYVVAEAIIFVPILVIAAYYCGDPLIIPKAGILTLCAFAGLTAAALLTRKDFSFLGPILSVGGFMMMGLIVISIFLPHYVSLGLWFSFLAVGLAAGYILYDTSNILHHYSTNMHVAASLALFSSIATMFYYILRILMQFSDRR